MVTPTHNPSMLKRLVVALLAVSFLVPILPLLMLNGAEACQMSCCRKAKAHCHRSSEQGHSAAWVAVSGCGSNCGHPATFAGHASAAIRTSATVLRHEAPPTLLSSSTVHHRLAATIAFALFQRPPPFA